MDTGEGMTLDELFQAELDKLGPNYAQFYHAGDYACAKLWFGKGVVAVRGEFVNAAHDLAKGTDTTQTELHAVAVLLEDTRQKLASALALQAKELAGFHVRIERLEEKA